MISTRIIFFVVALFAISEATKIQPYDLVDEAREQLVQLKTIVQGEILVAHDQLANEEVIFGTYAANVANTAAINLQQENDAVVAQLNAIKDLAHAANADVSTCTDVREQTLSRLPQRYAQAIGDCISGVSSEGRGLVENSMYIVDIAFSTVSHLEDQFQRCDGNLLCISPLLTEIELDKIRLPQNIRTEVQALQGTLTILKLSTQSCSDSNISEYSTESYSILGDIEACVNRILG